MDRRIVVLMPLLVMPAVADSAPAQGTGSAVETRLEALEQVVRSLEEQVLELGVLLRTTLPAPSLTRMPAASIDIEGAATKGSETARVVVIEFTDFECPFCARHAQGAFRELQREFVSANLLRYVIKNLPLEHLHPRASKAADAAECAGEQSRYWEMHDRLFANQQALATPDLVRHAGDLGLDAGQFESCLDEGRMLERVTRDLADAKRFGLTGTPSFLIGEAAGEGSVRVAYKITGAQPLQVFQAAIQRLLTRSGFLPVP